MLWGRHGFSNCMELYVLLSPRILVPFLSYRSPPPFPVADLRHSVNKQTTKIVLNAVR